VGGQRWLSLARGRQLHAAVRPCQRVSKA